MSYSVRFLDGTTQLISAETFFTPNQSTGFVTFAILNAEDQYGPNEMVAAFRAESIQSIVKEIPQ